MKEKERNKKGGLDLSKKTDPEGHPEIKTDLPLSEKDEVKQAEERLRKIVKKHD
jgi:hypothetical protein